MLCNRLVKYESSIGGVSLASILSATILMSPVIAHLLTAYVSLRLCKTLPLIPNKSIQIFLN